MKNIGLLMRSSEASSHCYSSCNGASSLVRYPLFWDVSLRHWVICSRHFEKTSSRKVGKKIPCDAASCLRRTGTSYTPLRKHKNSHASGLIFNLCNSDFLIRQANWVEFEGDYEKLRKNNGLLRTINRIGVQRST
jgi:hypothetical protein